MNLYFKLIVTGLFYLSLVGCESLPKKNEYADLAVIGINYTQSLNNVVDLAIRSHIDESSYTLIEQSELEAESAFISLDELPENASDDKRRRIMRDLQGELSEKVTKSNDVALEILAALNDYKTFNNLLGAYFERVAKLAGSSEADDLGIQLSSTIDSINNLTGAISSVSHLQLSDDDKAKLSSLSGYLVDRKITSVLAKRIKADSPAIESALFIQKEMLALLSDEIIKDQKAILAFKRKNLLIPELIDSQSLIKDPVRTTELISNRRVLLTTNADFVELKTANDLADTLNKALEKLAKGEQFDYLSSLTSLADKLERLDSLIKRFDD